MQEHLFEHFNEEGYHGFLEDVLITFIDKTHPSEPLKRENYWKNVLKTMAPLGLNIERQCLRNILWNHGRHDFGQDYGLRLLWLLIY